MEINWFIAISCTFIPLIIGMLWYSKFLFGNAWLKEIGMTVENTKKVNMGRAVAVSLLLGAFISTAMVVWTIHQMGFFSVFGSPADQALLKDPTSSLSLYTADFMSKYGQNFRTFKHGALHGVLGALFIVLPSYGISAVWEQRSFKYVAMHVGYWMVCMALIGGIICQWA